jgi:hypothetical protein
VRAASRAPQYQRCNQCTPVPSIKMRARGPRSQHATIACAGHHAFAPAPHVPPSAPRVGEEGGQGKERERPPPSSPPAGERKGARGKGRQRPPPSSPPAGERQGAGGKVRARQPCAAVPALQPVHPCSIHQDAGQRPALPARNHCVSNFRRSFSSAPMEELKGGQGEGDAAPPPSSPRRGAEGASGKGRQRPPPSSPPAGERKGAGGKVRARQPCAAVPGRNTLPPLPSRKGDAYPTCQRFSSATIRYLSFGMPLQNRINHPSF